MNPVPDTGANHRHVHSPTGAAHSHMQVLEAGISGHGPAAMPDVADAEPDKPQSAKVELTVLMPCLNEAETVTACVRKAVSFLADHSIDGEVVVADNGSTDGSQWLAANAGARVVSVAEPGYGNALLGGIMAARGQYVIMGDADDSYDFSALTPFVSRLRAGADLVMGNRFTGRIKPGAMRCKPVRPGTYTRPGGSRPSPRPSTGSVMVRSWWTCPGPCPGSGAGAGRPAPAGGLPHVPGARLPRLPG